MASTPIFKAVHNLIAVFLIEFHNADKKAFKTAKLLRVKAIQPRTIANRVLVPFQIAIDKVLIPFHIATIAFFNPIIKPLTNKTKPRTIPTTTF